MLRCLLVLVVVWRCMKVWRAHVKGCKGHVFGLEGDGGVGEVSMSRRREEELLSSDCGCAS